MDTALPPEVRKAKPRTISMVASVTISELTLSLATTQPFRKPITAPAARPAMIPMATPPVRSITTAVSTPASAVIEPTDRSTSRSARTNIIVVAIVPTSVTDKMRPRILRRPAKSGTRTQNPARTNTSNSNCTPKRRTIWTDAFMLSRRAHQVTQGAKGDPAWQRSAP